MYRIGTMPSSTEIFSPLTQAPNAVHRTLRQIEQKILEIKTFATTEELITVPTDHKATSLSTCQRTQLV